MLRPDECCICNSKFSRSSTLKIHYHSHTGEKPHKCKYEGCQKSFSERGNLKSHIRTHLSQKFTLSREKSLLNRCVLTNESENSDINYEKLENKQILCDLKVIIDQEQSCDQITELINKNNDLTDSFKKMGILLNNNPSSLSIKSPKIDKSPIQLINSDNNISFNNNVIIESLSKNEFTPIYNYSINNSPYILSNFRYLF